MKVRIERFQAVWERETFWVDAPDDLSEEALSEWAYGQLDLHDSGDKRLEPTLEIIGAVDGHDTDVEVIIQ